jgi:serine/threonine-protein kinase
LGTPDFVAPEQVCNARDVDARADIYSLGCTLYVLLAGQVPFPGGTSMQKAAAQMQRCAESLVKLRPDLPSGLAGVVDRMMEKSQLRRYPTAVEVIRALEPFSRGSPVRPRWASRWPIALAASLALLLGGLAITWSQPQPEWLGRPEGGNGGENRLADDPLPPKIAPTPLAGSAARKEAEKDEKGKPESPANPKSIKSKKASADDDGKAFVD